MSFEELNKLGELLAGAQNAQWTNIPEGIPLTPGKGRLVAGLGADTECSVAYEVHEDGAVTCDEGYEPIVEGHFIKGFRILTVAV